MSSSLNLGRFTRWIEKFLNVKGGSTISDVQGEVQVSLSLDKGVDHRILEGWQRYGTGGLVGAVSAQFAAMRLRNPAGSNVIAVIERLLAFGGVTDNPVLVASVTLSDFGTIISTANTAFDTRGLQSPTCILSKGNAATVTGNVLYGVTFPANVVVDFVSNPNTEMVLLPGSTLTVWSQVANQSILIEFVWRERALEQSELT